MQRKVIHFCRIMVWLSEIKQIMGGDCVGKTDAVVPFRLDADEQSVPRHTDADADMSQRAIAI